jgi:hypothetical protein
MQGLLSNLCAWLDNAGENKKLKECSKSANWKLDIEYKFTAWDTPEQNHLASPDASCKCGNEREVQAVS